MKKLPDIIPEHLKHLSTYKKVVFGFFVLAAAVSVGIVIEYNLSNQDTRSVAEASKASHLSNKNNPEHENKSNKSSKKSNVGPSTTKTSGTKVKSYTSDSSHDSASVADRSSSDSRKQLGTNNLDLGYCKIGLKSADASYEKQIKATKESTEENANWTIGEINTINYLPESAKENKFYLALAGVYQQGNVFLKQDYNDYVDNVKYIYRPDDGKIGNCSPDLGPPKLYLYSYQALRQKFVPYHRR